jgi:hypothetical protein
VKYEQVSNHHSQGRNPFLKADLVVRPELLVLALAPE